MVDDIQLYGVILLEGHRSDFGDPDPYLHLPVLATCKGHQYPCSSLREREHPQDLPVCWRNLHDLKVRARQLTAPPLHGTRKSTPTHYRQSMEKTEPQPQADLWFECTSDERVHCTPEKMREVSGQRGIDERCEMEVRRKKRVTWHL